MVCISLKIPKMNWTGGFSGELATPSPIWYGIDFCMFPAPDIDVESEVPIYRQVFQQLKDSIANGRLAKGSRLPATRELAGLLGLNRTTVSAVYELLESEGLISGQVGRGSFVTGEAPMENPGFDWRALLTPSAFAPLPSAPREAISFASSRPSEILFPVEEFRRSCDEVAGSAEIASILQPRCWPTADDLQHGQGRACPEALQ